MLQVKELSADYTNLITQADYQQFMRDDDTTQANVIAIMVESAIRQAEAICNASFGTKTYTMYRDTIKGGKKIYLPFAPVRSINEVAKVDPKTGAETVITTGFATFGLDRKYMVFNVDGIYKVTYATGYATPASADPRVKEAILQILSENWERRDQILVGTIRTIVPQHAAIKLGPFRNNIL